MPKQQENMEEEPSENLPQHERWKKMETCIKIKVQQACLHSS